MSAEKTNNSLPKHFMVNQPKTCPFHTEDASAIDYKNVRLMRKFLSSYNKILSRRRTGLCAKHQRQIANEIKKARHVALLSFVQRWTNAKILSSRDAISLSHVGSVAHW